MRFSERGQEELEGFFLGVFFSLTVYVTFETNAWMLEGEDRTRSPHRLRRSVVSATSVWAAVHRDKLRAQGGAAQNAAAAPQRRTRRDTDREPSALLLEKSLVWFDSLDLALLDRGLRLLLYKYVFSNVSSGQNSSTCILFKIRDYSFLMWMPKWCILCIGTQGKSARNNCF